jgi:hypothetical protein
MPMKPTPISTQIPSELKRMLQSFCQRKGLKIKNFIEQAILDKLEDETDIEAYEARKSEENIPLEKILKEFNLNEAILSTATRK